MKAVPSTPELIRGVARFLAEDLQPTIDDRGLAFRNRIAANILRMVAAELQRPPTPVAADAFGDADEEALLAALRERLAIVNPRFELRDDIP